MIATTFPSLYACSFVSLLQVQTKFFLAVKVFPSCSIRSSPSGIWQIMAFIIGGPAVFDPGCIMTSRIETVLNPGDERRGRRVTVSAYDDARVGGRVLPADSSSGLRSRGLDHSGRSGGQAERQCGASI